MGLKYFKRNGEYYTFSFKPADNNFIEIERQEYIDYLNSLPPVTVQPECFLDIDKTYFCTACPFKAKCSNKKS